MSINDWFIELASTKLIEWTNQLRMSENFPVYKGLGIQGRLSYLNFSYPSIKNAIVTRANRDDFLTAPSRYSIFYGVQLS